MTDSSADSAGRKTPKRETLRLVFSLDRDEDPRLYDDLMALRKGLKRTARLRLLAHDGLLVQAGLLTESPAVHGRRIGVTAPVAGAALTNQLFEPAADV